MARIGCCEVDFEEIDRDEFNSIPFAPEIEGPVIGGYGTALALLYIGIIFETFF